MSTRSIIAKQMGDAWEGRYCHSDGYPSGVGAELVKWGAAMGYEALAENLVTAT